MTRIIGITSFYDEKPAWLHDAIASIARHGVEHLVAVDGAYALFANGQPASPPEQHQAIEDTCRTHNIGLTLHVPRTTWQGNEIEKRTFCFRLAEQLAEPDDWYWSMDADQVVTDCPPDLKQQLGETKHDAAVVTFYEGHHERKVAQRATWDGDEFPVRLLFRAIPGLSVEGNHFTYVTPDGRCVWGNPHQQHIDPALDLSALRVEHRTWERDEERHRAQYDYYRRRDETGYERPRCAWCENTSTATVPYDWSLVNGTVSDVASGWLEVCTDHEDRAWAESEQQLVALVGIDNVAKLKPGDLKLSRGKVPA